MRYPTPFALPLLAVSLLISTLLPVCADTHTERREKSHGSDMAPAKDQIDEIAAPAPVPAIVLEVIELTNRERLKAGLPALKRQKNLQDSATWLARDMADRRYFDHHDSTGRDLTARITGFKYNDFSTLGENIAMGQRTAQEVVEGWMNSPGHRANILSRNFSEIGVGYVPSTGHGTQGYWVQDFGSRFDRCPVVINTDSATTTSFRVKLSIHGDDWVEAMRFSNDGYKWTPWEVFKPLRDWSLESGSGRKTVYIQVRHEGHVERIDAVVLVDGV